MPLAGDIFQTAGGLDDGEAGFRGVGAAELVAVDVLHGEPGAFAGSGKSDVIVAALGSGCVFFGESSGE